MDSRSLVAGILVAVLMFVFGLAETVLRDVIVGLAFFLTGVALLSWVLIVGREYRISRGGAKSITSASA